MRLRTVAAFVLGGLCALGGCLALGLTRPPQVHAQQVRPVKWEYSWVAGSDLNAVMQQLNKDGQDGWEAYAVTTGHLAGMIWQERRPAK